MLIDVAQPVPSQLTEYLNIWQDYIMSGIQQKIIPYMFKPARDLLARVQLKNISTM